MEERECRERAITGTGNMYELNVDGHFDAAHFLRGYPGDCGRMHGHSWKITVTVAAKVLGPLGMALDFKVISRRLEAAVAEFDHRVLNELPSFTEENPTAEIIARLLFERLSRELNDPSAAVTAVTVAESERYRVTYRPGDR